MTIIIRHYTLTLRSLALHNAPAAALPFPFNRRPPVFPKNPSKEPANVNVS
jgi:hypothetical protein